MDRVETTDLYSDLTQALDTDAAEAPVAEAAETEDAHQESADAEATEATSETTETETDEQPAEGEPAAEEQPEEGEPEEPAADDEQPDDVSLDDLTRLDPANLAPELKPYYRQLKRGFDQFARQTAPVRKAIEKNAEQIAQFVDGEEFNSPEEVAALAVEQFLALRFDPQVGKDFLAAYTEYARKQGWIENTPEPAAAEAATPDAAPEGDAAAGEDSRLSALEAQIKQLEQERTREIEAARQAQAEQQQQAAVQAEADEKFAAFEEVFGSPKYQGENGESKLSPEDWQEIAQLGFEQGNFVQLADARIARIEAAEQAAQAKAEQALAALREAQSNKPDVAPASEGTAAAEAQVAGRGLDAVRGEVEDLFVGALD